MADRVARFQPTGTWYNMGYEIVIAHRFQLDYRYSSSTAGGWTLAIYFVCRFQLDYCMLEWVEPMLLMLCTAAAIAILRIVLFFLGRVCLSAYESYPRRRPGGVFFCLRAIGRKIFS